MRRLTAVLFISPAALLGAASPSPYSWDVTLRNPIDVARPDSMIEIPGTSVDVRAAAWTATANGKPVPTQLVDRDGDGNADSLLLLVDLGPSELLHVRLDPEAALSTPSRVQAMVGVRRAATLKDGKWVGGKIEEVDRLDLDSSHVAGDRLTLYDGPGWESDRIGFRVYLDQRNALDLFGKKNPAPVLQWIGRGVGDYHKEADWGMDILHVTDSLGAGGIGVIEKGHVRQVGVATGGVSGGRIANGPVMAGVAATNRGLSAEATKYDLFASYTINAGARVTDINATASAHVPIVAGIERRPAVAVLKSRDGAWGYIATYGQQSFIGDGLGMAILYRITDVAEVGDDGHTVFIRFKDPRHIRYSVSAAWAKESGGIVNQLQFQQYLLSCMRALNRPIVVTVKPLP